MNPIDDDSSTLDKQRFDLLVDGELPEAERRNLLSQLDDVPGGWRRCALAFLEAQSWQDEMRSIQRESPVAAQAARRVGRPGFPGGVWGTLVAMAASFTIALGLGLLLNDVWRADRETGPSPIEVAKVPEEPPRPAAETVRPDAAPGPNVRADSWQLVTLPVGFGPGGESIQLPAREMDHIDEGWLEQSAPAVPGEVLQAFQQSGHEVGRHRSWLRFPMDDGRQLVVPYEQVELRYVRDPAYH